MAVFRFWPYRNMNQATPFRIRYEVVQEDGVFVARCLDLDVISDGATDAEAVANLREAIMLHCERHAEALAGLENTTAADAQALGED